MWMQNWPSSILHSGEEQWTQHGLDPVLESAMGAEPEVLTAKEAAMPGTYQPAAFAQPSPGHRHKAMTARSDKKAALSTDSAYTNVDGRVGGQHGWIPCHAIHQLDIAVVGVTGKSAVVSYEQVLIFSHLQYDPASVICDRGDSVAIRQILLGHSLSPSTPGLEWERRPPRWTTARVPSE